MFAKPKNPSFGICAVKGSVTHAKQPQFLSWMGGVTYSCSRASDELLFPVTLSSQ